MDYLAALTAARSVANMWHGCKDFADKWNALEDSLLALPAEVIAEFVAKAYAETAGNHAAAQVLISILEV